jgi:glycine/D-amino acid oxidase-like deaminating enzyme
MDLLLLGQNRPTDIGSDILIMSAEEISTQEPGLVTLGDGVLLRDQDRVQPLKLAAALANRVGVIATKTELLEIVVEHGRVTRALTSRGQVSPGAVLFATGSPPAVLAPWIRLDHEQVKGHLIATEPVPFRLRFALKNGGLSLTQLTDGTLLFGGTVDEGDISECVRPSVVRHLIGQLHRLAPSAIDARVIHSWCCFRPAVQDRQPVVDKVPEVENSWITFGHFRTGLLMAPIVGASLAKWILKGEVDNLIKPFQLRVPRM